MSTNEPYLVSDINQTSYGSNPRNFINAGGILYFIADNDVNGTELWKSDPNTGVVSVVEINPGSGSGSSNPNYLTNVNGTLYFTAQGYNGANYLGNELWKIDPTTGTPSVIDVVSGSGSSSPSNLTNVNGVLYFIASTSATGYELWKIDATTGSPVFLKDIHVGSGSSNPGNLTYSNGKLYFTADNLTQGVELWVTDGTTEMLQALKSENDRGTIHQKGQVITVEQQDFTGTAGNDSIIGTTENDLMLGGGGNDTLYGDDGQDGLYGEDGDDYLKGGSGDDGRYLFLGDVNNKSRYSGLYGGDGNDTLEGGEGDDNLDGETGNDHLLGGDGHDSYYVDSLGDTIIENANEGFDYVYSSISYSIENLPNIEGLALFRSNGNVNGTGNNFRNYIYGNSDNNILSGLGGDDFLYASEGNDSLDGGAEKDELTGVAYYTNAPGIGEIDTLRGGTGSDKFILGNSTKVFYDDGNSITAGQADYALIKDLNVDEDVIVLSGTRNNYLFGVSPITGISGTAIYRLKSAGEPNELIGLIEGVTGLNFNSDSFGFASVLFNDNFDTENDGLPQDDYTELANWNIINPSYNEFPDYYDSVDLLDFNSLEIPSYELSSFNGLFLDLDNSILESKQTFSFNAGEIVTLDISIGDPDLDNTNNQDYVVVSLGNLSAYHLSLDNYSYQSANYSLSWTITEPTDANLIFRGYSSSDDESADNGILIDNLQLSVISNLDRIFFGKLAFSNAEFLVNENGTSVIAVTVVRTNGSDGDVSATINLSNSTATAPSDYNSSQITVNFASGEISKIVTVPITDDTVFEGDETLNLTLTNPTGGATLGTQTIATLTIIDNDLPSITLAVNPTSVTEDGTSNLVYTFTRTGNTVNSLTVYFEVGGSADWRNDYNFSGASSFSGVYYTTFAAGASTATIICDPTSDNRIESDETVAITITPDSSYTISTGSAVTGTIIDVPPPNITLSLNPTSVTEDGTSNLVYTFTRAGKISEPLTVYFSPSGSAVFGSDYTQTGAANFSDFSGYNINFAAGASTATLIINPIADNTFESDETVGITLSSVSGLANYTVGTIETILGRIVNDDVQLPNITLSVNPASVTEDGTSNLVYTFTRTGSTTNPLAVDFLVDSGSATSGVDYTYTSSNQAYLTSRDGFGNITFAASANTVTLTINPTADSNFETDEAVSLFLYSDSSYDYTVGTTGAVTGIILNDDVAKRGTLALSNSQFSINENGIPITAVNVIRTGGSDGNVSATINLTDGTATAPGDYNNTPIVLDFANGETSITVTVPIVNDAIAESNETINLTLANPQGGATLGTQTTAVLTIIDNDQPKPGTLAFSQSSFTVNEDGTPVAVVTVTRTGGSDGAVSATVNLTNGSAIAPNDYNNTPITVSFAEGETSKTVTIPITNDALVEGNETINLSLTNPTGGAILGTQQNATLVIVDNDVQLAFANTTFSVNEDGNPVNQVTVLRSGLTSTAVSVLIELSDGTATATSDYTNTPITVNFAAGETSKTVTIPLVNDSGNEPTETVNLTLTNPTGGATLGTQKTAILNIVDNDAVPGVIQFSNASYSINENGTPVAAVTLTRTGGSDGAVSTTVNLTNGTASAGSDYNNSPITVNFANGETSKTVTIPIIDDSILESNETINLSLSNPTNGATIGTQNSAIVNIIDNDFKPTLSVSITAEQFTEGNTIQGTVTRNTDTTEPLTITLVNSDNTQITVPTTVTIPAGASSVNFNITAVDDTLIELPKNYTIIASASGFISGSDALAIIDNDEVTLSLTVDTTNINENGGKAIATVTRNIVTNSPLVVQLSSSDTTEATVPATVTIAANQASATFEIQGVDDTIVDGTQPVIITAKPTYTNTNVAVQTGNATANLNVIDNESPSLNIVIDKDVIAETGTATATITRNTNTNSELVVTLNSSDTTEATVPNTVTIAAGQTSATFAIAGVSDGINDGSQTVNITASANGLNSDTDSLEVTDINVSDLAVTQLQGAQPTYTGKQSQFTYTVANTGIISASGSWKDQVYLSADNKLDVNDILLGEFGLGSTENPANLLPGTSYDRTVAYFAPRTPGQYYLIGVTDTGNTVNEGVSIGETNNTTITPLTITPAYRATVSSDTDTTVAGNPVTLRGTALSNSDNSPVAFEFVKVRVENKGNIREFDSFTDANGNFVRQFTPLPGEAGTYNINAYFPGFASEDSTAEDQFTLLGMRFEQNDQFLTQVSQRITEGTTFNGSVKLQNLSNLELSGLTASINGAPSDWTVNLTPEKTNLLGNEEITVNYSINVPDDKWSYYNFSLGLSSAEGVTATLPVRVDVAQLLPRLVADTSRLQASMLRGGQTLVEFTVSNQGAIASGELDILLPDASWLKLASPVTLPSLNPGESTKVSLLLQPSATQELTVYNGDVVIAGDEASLRLPFDFRAVSEAKGNLQINVVDELFFFAEGSPQLENATISLLDPYTGAVVFSEQDADGSFSKADLAEGYYTLRITADSHDTYQQNIYIGAGETEDVQAFLSRQTVKYTWTVTPTEIEDVYTISVQSTFETDVPIPVVTIDPPLIDLKDLQVVGQVMQINMTLTNHGLIAANDIKLNFGSHPFYKIEPLLGEIDILAAKSSLTVPVRVTRIADFDTLPNSNTDLSTLSTPQVPCSISGSLNWSYPCGGNNIQKSTIIAFNNVDGNCAGGAGSGGGAGGGGSGSIFSPVPIIYAPTTPCCEKDLDTFHIEVQAFIPYDRVINPLYDPYYDDPLNPPGYVIPPYPSPLPGGQYYEFGGDGATRDFVSDKSRSRMWSEVFLTADGCEPASYTSQNGVNLTTGYDVWGNLIGSDRDPEAVMSETVSSSSSTITVNLKAEVGNPLIILPPFGRVAPDADYDFTLTLTRERDEWKWDLQGAYDGFPAYAVFLNDTLIVKHDPRVTGDTALSLFPFIGDYLVPPNTNGSIPSDNPPCCESPNSNSVSIQQNQQEVDSKPITPQQTPQDSVCARVTIQIDQEAVMTRSAFLGNLEIDNGSASNLENLSVTLQIKDENGNIVNDLFGITDPIISNITAVDGTGILTGDDPNTPQDEGIGSAQWTFIPTNLAAPEIATQYSIGGTLSYLENGTTVTVPLISTPITVFPQAELHLDYFHQRDVFADDPFTNDIVETSVPYSLAVLVRNEGKGEATNLKITSGQPKIIDNEKGLLIDFQIIGSEVNGTGVSPSLSVNFGNIEAGETAVAEWLLKSSLQGKFIDYKATFEHVNSLGKAELSLIKEVTIHELIHQVQVNHANPDNLPDFLVNETFDAQFTPDIIYFSSGGTAPVNAVKNAIIDAAATLSDLTVQITATVDNGWTYFRLAEPSNSQFDILKIQRSDGTQISLDNIWTTDRTFPATGRPIYENILHFFDNTTAGNTTYTVVYTSGGPTVSDIIDVTPDPRSTSINAITVDFSEAVQASTFDIADITLTRDGSVNLITPAVSIIAQSATRFQITGLGDLTNLDGNYTLSVNAAGIQDTSGKPGTGSVSEAWVKTPTGNSDTTLPTVSDIVDLLSDPRNQPVNSLNVTFSEKIDLSTFTWQDITLTRNGGTNLINNSVTVTAVNDTTYRINGLSGLTLTDGTYTLTVNGNGIQDLSGNTGTGTQSETWVMDTTAPSAPTNIVVSNVIASDSEAISSNLGGSEIASLRSTSFAMTNTSSGQTRINTTTPTISGELGETGLKVFFYDKNTNQLLQQATVTGTQFSSTVQLPSSGARELEIRVEDAAGNTTNTTLSLFADVTQPVLTQFLNLPTSTPNPVNTIDVQFSEQIDLNTFDKSDLTLTRDGQTLTLPNTVTVTYLSDTTYRINGLDSLTNTPGIYSLRVDATTIQDNAGNSGDAAKTATFTIAAPSNPGITLTQTGGNTNVTEGGNTDTYSLVLKTQPTSDVTITLNPDSQITLNQTTFTFTSANWNTPQNVTVTAVDDTITAGTDTATITHTVNSTDTNYNGLAIPAVNVGIQDNDAEIKGTVWHDIDGNTVDNNEPNLSGWTVYLDSNNNNKLDTGETSTQTDANGNYSFTNLRPGTYTVAQIVQDGWKQTHPILNITTTSADIPLFIPTLDFISSTNNETQLNFNAANYIVKEDRTAITEITVTLSGNATSAVTATLSFADGTAKGCGCAANSVNNDFNNIPITFTLAANEISKVISVQNALLGNPNAIRIRNDNTVEGDEYFTIKLTNPTNGAFIGNQGIANITIVDDESPSNIPVNPPLANPSNTISDSQNTNATNLINLDDFWADSRFANIKGQGYTTVIIDTGADLNHPLFGADANNDGIADRIVYQYDFADNDTDASDKNNHGSHITSIASQLAPDANLIILKVFSDSGSGSFADLETALQWVNANANAYNIASVNLSLGDSQNWNSANSRYGIGDELAAIASQNILIAAAAGNGFYTFNSNPGLAYPAIDPNVISVGAVWADTFASLNFSNGSVDYSTAADRIASFSQRHPLLDVFAPGILITGANANGGTVTMGGTSQAAPYVSGIALLAQQIAQQYLNRQLTVNEFRTLLDSTSNLINDGDDENDNVINTGANYSRINLLALAEGILKLGNQTPDDDPIDPGNGNNDDDTSANPNSVTFSHTVPLTAGQTATDINFGNQQQEVPRVTLAVAPSSVSENGSSNSNLLYTFTRTGDTTNPLTVNFTLSGAAVYKTDYTVKGATVTNLTGKITFASGKTTAILTIDPTGDKLIEDNEILFVTLASGTDYNIETIEAIAGTILNDDGGSNDDLLNGTPGNDSLDGGIGNDTMIGGLGNDKYFVDSLGDVITENPNEGTDTVNTTITYTLGNDLEKLILLGTDNLTGTGNDSNNTLSGNSGNNTLIGLAGNDILDGGLGEDNLIGGTGNDTYTLDTTGDSISENAQEGTDTVKTSFDYSLENTNLENITLLGSSNPNATGNSFNNTLTGNSGNNILIGNAGNDNLRGGVGNDNLVGGEGNDSLTGGGGLDTFRFDSLADGSDRVTDFNVIDDTLQISSSGFGGGLSVGILDASLLRVGAGITSADTAAQRLIFNTTTGALFFDADGSGTLETATQFAKLSPQLALTAANFIVV